MIDSKMGTLLRRLGWMNAQPAKRIARQQRVWGTETEQLENRALLSAANKVVDLDDAPADVATLKAQKRVPIPITNVTGAWTVSVSGAVSGTGVVSFTQKGRRVTATLQLGIPGFENFKSVANFRPKSPSHIEFKTPRIAIEELDGFRLRLTIKLDFPQGQVTPTTFSGVVTAPFVGAVATVGGVKAQPQT